MMEKIQKVLLVLCIFIPVLILCGSNGQKTNLNDGYGEYVFVAAGEFDMGDLFNEGHSDEIPVHSVYLDDYYIGKFKVTNGEFKQFARVALARQ